MCYGIDGKRELLHAINIFLDDVSFFNMYSFVSKHVFEELDDQQNKLSNMKLVLHKICRKNVLLYNNFIVFLDYFIFMC